MRAEPEHAADRRAAHHSGHGEAGLPSAGLQESLTAPAADLVANVVVSGILTGLVYGLMALGLSVIFGVVRVVNFAHGEMMTIAMYIAIVLFQSLKLDPLVMMVPIAGVLFCLGYVMQAG